MRLFRATDGKRQSVEEWLRFWLSASNTLIAVGFFGYILVRKMRLETYFGTSDMLDLASQALTLDRSFWGHVVPYFQGEGTVILLSVATVIWYLRYIHAVRNEMDVLVRFYSKFNPPENWQSILGSRWVPFLAIGITLAFIALAYFVDRLDLYCIVMLILNVLDIRGNSMLRVNLTRHFADPDFHPLEGDFYRPFINRRREVAAEYWIYRPQVERIGIMMIATMIAFILASPQAVFGFTVTKWLPYSIVVLVIVGNELTMARWRIVRDKALHAIEVDEEEAERVRDGIKERGQQEGGQTRIS